MVETGGVSGLKPALDAARMSPPGWSFGLIVLLIGLSVLFSALLPDRFATFGTLRSVMFQLPELGLLSLAMVVPLISGGLNLSIIATANMAALLMAYVMTSLLPSGASPAETYAVIALACGAGLVLCLVIGLATGFLVATMGVHPILVTLGAMSLLKGISVYLTRGTVISGFPEPFLWIGNGSAFGIPIPFLIFLGVAFAVALILSRTAFGISVFMAGSNLEATRYAGVDTRRTLIGVYTLSSVLCWIAAMLMMARFNSASAAYAESYLLITILAAVLGGVDPFGGFGRILGLFLALLVLQAISSGFNLLGLSQHLTLAIWGLTLLFVMAAKIASGPLLARLFGGAARRRTKTDGNSS